LEVSDILTNVDLATFITIATVFLLTITILLCVVINRIMDWLSNINYIIPINEEQNSENSDKLIYKIDDWVKGSTKKHPKQTLFLINTLFCIAIWLALYI